MEKITHKKQENISALFSVAGNLATMGIADAPAIAASCLYLCGNAVMFKYGHTSWGLSAAWAIYSAGNAVMSTSKILENNPTLHAAFVSYCALFAAGMLRYPLGHAGKWLYRKARSAEIKEGMIAAGRNLVRAATKSKPYVGATAVALDVGLVLSTLFGNPHKVSAVMVGASLCWITADFLAGRVQKLLRKPISCVKNAFAPS